MRPRRLLRLLSDFDCKIQYHHGKASVAIHEARVEALKKENVKDENLHGMDKEFENRLDETLYFRRRNKIYHNLKQLPQWPIMEKGITTYVSKCLMCLKMRNDHPKPSGLLNYADVRRKPLEFQIEDKAMLKVSPQKGVICFSKHGKLDPRYIKPFRILFKVGAVTYRPKPPELLSRTHSTFHVSNLKEYLSGETLAIQLDEIQIDDTLYPIEEPIEIINYEVKRLKQSRIPNVKMLRPKL
ncbi:hypothetical protein Tco_0932722 [Tanacetum coccineum]